MRWKELLQDYFYFSRKDRLGLSALICLILLIYALPRLFPRNPAEFRASIDTNWLSSTNQIDNQVIPDSLRKTYPGLDSTARVGHTELFYFDPNLLPPADWSRLGIREKTIQTISRYLAKGGRFRSAGDLGKIYGLGPQDVERLIPFVRIRDAEKKNPVYQPKPFLPPHRKPPLQPFDINQADSLQWMALPGIGRTLASRILHFRDRLGGFHAAEQIRETYGLPDSVFQQCKDLFRVETPPIRRLDINREPEETLRKHPYISGNVARAIVAYRNQHGAFHSLDELKKVLIISEDLYQKIRPYLTADSR